jgi:hypothetical protein
MKNFHGAFLAVEGAVKQFSILSKEDSATYLEWLQGEAVSITQRAEIVEVHVDDALRILLEYESTPNTEVSDKALLAEVTSSSPPASIGVIALLEKDVLALTAAFTSLVDIAAAFPVLHWALQQNAAVLREVIQVVHEDDKDTGDVALRTLSRAFSRLQNPLRSVFQRSAQALARVAKMCATRSSGGLTELQVMLLAQSGGKSFAYALHNEAREGASAVLEFLLLPTFHSLWSPPATLQTFFSSPAARALDYPSQIDNTAFLKRVLLTFPRFVVTVTHQLCVNSDGTRKQWTHDTEEFMCWMVTRPWFETQCRTYDFFPRSIRMLLTKAAACHSLRALDTLHDCFAEHIDKGSRSAITAACATVSPRGAEVLTRLLHWRVDPSALDEEALEACVHSNNIACTKILLQDSRVNPLQGFNAARGSIPLLDIAARQNHFEIVRDLLQHERVKDIAAVIDAARDEGDMTFTSLEYAAVCAYVRDPRSLLLHVLLETNPHLRTFLFESHHLPLRKALLKGDVELVMRITKKPQFVIHNEDKEHLLHCVTRCLHLRKECIVTELLNSASCAELLINNYRVLRSDANVGDYEGSFMTTLARRVAEAALTSSDVSATGKRKRDEVSKD